MVRRFMLFYWCPMLQLLTSNIVLVRQGPRNIVLRVFNVSNPLPSKGQIDLYLRCGCTAKPLSSAADGKAWPRNAPALSISRWKMIAMSPATHSTGPKNLVAIASVAKHKLRSRDHCLRAAPRTPGRLEQSWLARHRCGTPKISRRAPVAANHSTTPEPIGNTRGDGHAPGPRRGARRARRQGHAP